MDETSATLERRWNPRVIEVATSTMDVESVKLGIPDLVKIDVEGAELEVLRGGQRMLRDHRPILLLECTRRQDEVRQILGQWATRFETHGPPPSRSPARVCRSWRLPSTLAYTDW